MISIIVPIYNAERYLKRCLDSILHQTYRDIEIILINDGSTDSSLKICKEYEKIDTRIILLNQENKGVSEARNQGIRVSKNKYIQFVDSDDYIDQNMCQDLIKLAENYKIDLVVCGFKSITPWNKKMVSYSNHKYNNVKSLEIDFKYLYEHAFFHSMCNKLYKKIHITNLLNSELSIGEDLFFNLDYLKNVNEIITTSTCYYNYTSTSNTSLSKILHSNELLLIENRYKYFLNFCNIYFESSYIINILSEKMICDYLAAFKKRLINRSNYYQEYLLFKKYSSIFTHEIRNMNIKEDRKIKLIIKRKFFELWIQLIIESKLEKIKVIIKNTKKES